MLQSAGSAREMAKEYQAIKDKGYTVWISQVNHERAPANTAQLIVSW